MSRIRPKNGVGASSILLIIVVLLLTTFGVLTLVSARADRTLTARTVEATSAYYIADAAAQQRLMALDLALEAGETPDALPYLTAEGNEPDLYAFTCETGDGRAIQAIVRIPPDARRCTVVAYKLIHLTDWAGTESFQLASPAQ